MSNSYQFKKSALFSGIFTLSAEKFLPHLVGSYTNPDGGNLQEIIFKNGLAYISASENGLQVLDVSNPESPTKVGSFKLYYGIDVDLSGNLAYNADSSYGLRILDVSNPNAPVEIGGYATKDSGFVFCKSVTLSGSLAYLVMEGIDSDFADNGILIIDVSNPYRPTKLNSFPSAFEATDLAISGNQAYVTSGNAGLLIYDVSNPYNPHQIGSYDVEGFSCVGTTINGNFAYELYNLSNSRGTPNILKVLDISNPSSPQLVANYDSLNVLSVVAEGESTYAFAGDFKPDGSGFLQILDLTNPNNPSWLTGFDASQGIPIRSDVPITGIAIHENFVYITESFNGLQVIQFKDNVPLPVLNISSVDADKPESSGAFLFKIERSGDLSSNSVVDYSVSGGQATNDDFITNSGSVVFKPGETSKVVVINVANDSTFESDEAFIVELSNPLNATLGNAEAVGTIINDDANHTIPTEGDDDLIGTANDDVMKGLGGNDQLSSLDGNDSLNGGVGADTMQGGVGNDTYYVDNARDIVIETSTITTEIDTVYSETSFTLSENVENLVLVDSVWAVKAIGNSSNNILEGNRLANLIDGKKGMDTMIGGDGDDTYMVDSSKDIIKEVGSDSIAGNDSVKSAASFLLPTNVENLYLIGTSAINGTGNALKNTIVGNAYDNVINGGLGKDTLTGGLGKDTFLFDTPLKSNVDKITDFKPVDDTIRLENAIFTKLKITTDHLLDKANFVKSTSAVDGNDYVIYNSTTGALFYDADGNGSSAAVQIATLGAGLNLTHADFLVS
ncbi:Calx-beta domain-containing protein [Methylovulum psychrotolerans]|uniref:Poly(Beta-D-mannuronate) C5 epimerase 1 n=1 Tax=Methylovulum psychrotolerans TaxID=1704499 RepID=A0A2S5CIR6_9GAMM|nr:Calx-beta domain-containing protein [Methylovulum psychrotolerans]POZ50708.1 Poly(beta-D-mannuronate) C5 epimerase 1 [Methylovulum psychrotolerans]